MAQQVEVHLYEVLESVRTSNLRDRLKALKSLKSMLDGSENANLSPLTDKAYHKIYEVLFKIALDEKASVLAAKKNTLPPAANRLTTCADLIRLAVKAGAKKLRPKTIKAVVDHLLQTLQNAEGEFFEPLTNYYLRTLCAVLEHKPNVELISPDDWRYAAIFCVQGINKYLDGVEAEPSGLSRSFSGLGTGSTPATLAISSYGNSSYYAPGRTGNVSKQNADDFILALQYLVSTTNPPLPNTKDPNLDTSHDIVSTLMRFLGWSSSMTGTRAALSALNAVLSCCREDHSLLLQFVAKQIVPIICRFWQGKSRDEGLNTVRDEMIILILNVHLHLEKCILDAPSSEISANLEDLLVVMRAEYARRNDRDRLHFDDLDFTDLGTTESSINPFQLHAFSLRPHNLKSERHWATLQVMGILERLVNLDNTKSRDIDETDNDNQHPRKRQRVAQPSDRFLDPIKSEDESLRLVGLQVLPFVLQNCQLSASILAAVLGQLSVCTSDTRNHIASWALLAIASCAHQEAAIETSMKWDQLWHIGARALTFSATCRAAASELHTILTMRFVRYHEIGEDIEAMIVAADVSGPVLLCDSSVRLMMHILHARVTEVPGASLVACNHVIRWLFARWDPSNRSMAAHLTVHIQPHCLVDLLRTTLGLNRVNVPAVRSVACGPIGQSWEQHLRTQSANRYLLLLDEPINMKSAGYCTTCPKHAGDSNITYISDSVHFQTTRKLILELIGPKLTDLLQTWKSDRASAISLQRFSQSIYACITTMLLMPHLVATNSPQFHSLETDLESLLLELMNSLRGSANRSSNDTEELVRALLETVQPEIPACRSSKFVQLAEKNSHLLRFLAMISEVLCEMWQGQSLVSGPDVDMIDITDFTSQQSQTRADSHQKQISRQTLVLDSNPSTFAILVTERIMLIAASIDTSQTFRTIPSTFIDRLLSLPTEDLLSCRQLLVEVFESDLIMSEVDASRLLEHLGEILSSNEWSRCEPLHCLCLDVLFGLIPLWSQTEGTELANDALQMYSYFIDVGIDEGIASPETLKRLSIILLSLMKFDSRNTALSTMRSPRSSLLLILEGGNATVKFYVGTRIPDIFEFYLLKDHENIFVDVLDKLPSSGDWPEGIALRLFVLAQLASRWTSLLRRCIYHVFEAPKQVTYSTRHATRCLNDISVSLKVEGPRELFSLFAPQLLYTYLEAEDIREIPYEIFGFETRGEMLSSSKQVAAGLMVMRGQIESLGYLGELLQLKESEILRDCFTNIMAYGIAYAMTTPSTNQSKRQAMGEAWLLKRLDHTVFIECLNFHFTEIIALLFNTIDQGDGEKHLLKNEGTVQAGKILHEIKSMNASAVILPPNQQPNFRARYLTHWIAHICGRIHQATEDLYTPALVIFIARTLLDTIHPALGSLHACSVLRKIRLLVALSGDVAVQGYPLEMLLTSVVAFMNDVECADDCFGMIQYLLTRGSVYLSSCPSFVAGIALNTLGYLGKSLRSSQTDNTQDTQHQETMSKARILQSWIKAYIADYYSSSTAKNLGSVLPAIIDAADTFGTVGNATKGTPESSLLLHLLEDQQVAESLLSQPSREAALAMLYANFQGPTSFRTDIFGTDKLAIDNTPFVWNSCKGDSVSLQYLSWAGRVLGRAFAASGHIHQELLRESDLSQIMQLARDTEKDFSRACILSLLQSLTLGQDRRALGLAEAALRAIVSTDDPHLNQTCKNILSTQLYDASVWFPYYPPPSQINTDQVDIENVSDPFTADAILRPFWLRDLAIVLARFVPDDVVLRALMPVLHGVPGFAGRAFPFILHIVISTPSQAQTLAKKKISDSLRIWFKNSASVERNNLKMLINAILYLRTQPLANEKSSADRSYWLDIDYLKAAVAATHCGMFKTALLFVEEFHAGPILIKTSRRASGIAHEVKELPTEVLLSIFQNIDDPDLYYGIQQDASLSTILARLEYERDGTKSLAFRGAQYDSHVRRKDQKSAEDVQSLVKSLDVLNLSGLALSLLQGQQSVGMSSASLESMFTTARKLEQWDIPVPETSKDNAVTIYKAFQAIHNSTDSKAVSCAIDEGLQSTMSGLIREDLNANALHSSLRTLATFVEMDEVLSTRGSVEFEDLLEVFRSRSDWMKIGRFDDIGHILSCRGTTLSELSEQSRLRKVVDLQPVDARLVEIHTVLLSSRISRSHNALQESLSLATSLMDLIVPCQKMGLNLEAAIHVEAANALWDQGEMSSSIGMLQALDKNSSLKKQAITVGRSDLLSKIGSQVSTARLEKPDQILEKYLKPALKELKGKTVGPEAGQVFHEFAVFCDQQLQDVDGIEDLDRLRKLSENKRKDVESLTKIYNGLSSNADKTDIRRLLSKNKTWLKLDHEELQRAKSTREEFLRQSLENYLLALVASDDNDRHTLRFSALWMEHSEEQMANEAVSKYLAEVPSRKFAPLMNQLTSRLQDTTAKFQELLFTLVRRICTDHPFHGMYQIYGGINSSANKTDQSATLRQNATIKIGKYLANTPKSSGYWRSINTTNKVYCSLAAEKDDHRYKSGRKVELKNSAAGHLLGSMLSRYPIPPLTMQIKLAADCDYSNLPVMTKFESQFSIASGVSMPKIITAIADNGAKYKQLVKGGNDDLRQDAIMEQVFEQVSELLRTNRSTRQRDLSIRTYKVLPLTSIAGVIEFVANTIPLHEYLMPAHERYYPKDLKGNQCRKEIGDVQSQSVSERIKKFQSVLERFHPVMRYFFTEKFNDPDEWFVKRLAYTRSTAAISILGHVLGLGDRHGHNILLDGKSGEVVHIDLGVAFEMGRVLPVPELVPFRLTRDIVNGMGITKTEGVFRRCCEFTLEALRKETYSIMTILDVLRYDPLYSWSISPVRLARLQDQSAAHPDDGALPEKTKEVKNEPGEADRALTVVSKKLSKTLSVTATVNDLINQASDEKNLAVLYSGWAAYA